MKKVLLVAALLVGSLSFGQETQFTFNKEGFTDYIVTPVEGKTQKELYLKALNWISVTYNNPKEVIKAQIENEYIRIEGVKSNMFVLDAGLGIKIINDGRYQIEISFKDGKYKFDVIKLETYVKPDKYSSGGWTDINTENTTSYYRENGAVRNIFKNYPQSIENTFNILNYDLLKYIGNNATVAKNENW